MIQAQLYSFACRWFNNNYQLPIPNKRSINVGEFDGIVAESLLLELLVDELVDSVDSSGSGLICSPKTSKRLSAVPSGVHVMSVTYGLSLPIKSALTSVGLTTCVRVIL